jgi:hypothetical protein
MPTNLNYARMPENDVYHLIDTKSSSTLCGLKVTMLSSNGLQVIQKKPDRGRLCRHCDDTVDTGLMRLEDTM